MPLSPMSTEHPTSRPAPDSTGSASFWSYAAAFGALWGSVEITLGTFLNTLRLPFAGVILASIGVVFLVAARQIVPRRGTSIATGLVAALAKSLSPGGIILGPMIGILSEAAVVELVLLPAPRARPAAALAGIICALWAASQKILTQVLLYGSVVLDLYLTALGRARSWLDLPPSTGWWAAAGLSILIATIGATAGIIGHRVGVVVVAKRTSEGVHAQR